MKIKDLPLNRSLSLTFNLDKYISNDEYSKLSIELIKSTKKFIILNNGFFTSLNTLDGNHIYDSGSYMDQSIEITYNCILYFI